MVIWANTKYLTAACLQAHMNSNNCHQMIRAAIYCIYIALLQTFKMIYVYYLCGPILCLVFVEGDRRRFIPGLMKWLFLTDKRHWCISALMVLSEQTDTIVKCSGWFLWFLWCLLIHIQAGTRSDTMPWHVIKVIFSMLIRGFDWSSCNGNTQNVYFRKGFYFRSG